MLCVCETLESPEYHRYTWYFWKQFTAGIHGEISISLGNFQYSWNIMWIHISILCSLILVDAIVPYGQQFNSDTSLDLVAMKIVIVILLCERSLAM